METATEKTGALQYANKELGLYDSANGLSVIAYKMIDATELCEDVAACVIKYADVVRGKIAQINKWYKADKDLGVSVHYHISEMNADELAIDEVFYRYATGINANPYILAQFIFDNE